MGPISTILTDESKWTKGAFARNQNGVVCDLYGADACKYCLTGFVCLVSQHDIKLRRKIYSKLDDAIVKYTKETNTSIMLFNDGMGTTFEDVKKVLEIANL